MVFRAERIDGSARTPFLSNRDWGDKVDIAGTRLHDLDA